MIDYRQGNLLEADAEALVNTVNCVGVMGKGIALQFKKAFPDNFRQYEKACRSGQVQLGKILTVATHNLTNPKHIINFPTKHDWREKSKLENIRSGLEALVIEIQRLKIHSIAIPPLGCGNGGLKWKQVEPLITDAFATLPDVQVFLFEPSGAPNVEAMRISADKPTLTRARALLIRLMDLYQISNYSLSLLEIQKLAYFLQISGEPLKLNYVKEKYGPYAGNLNHVLQILDGHYLRGYGDRSQRAEIHLLPDAIEQSRSFLAEIPDAEARLERVRRLIEGFESPYGMELLATVLWVAQEESQIAGDAKQIVSKVQQWSERKRNLFKVGHIQKAWQRLREEDWC